MPFDTESAVTRLVSDGGERAHGSRWLGESNRVVRGIMTLRLRQHHIVVTLLALLCLHWICSMPGFAQNVPDRRLSVDLASTSPRVRSNSPIQLIWKVFWNDSTLVEGHFDLTYWAYGQEKMYAMQSHDMVLTPGEQSMRIIIPASGMTTPYAMDEIAVRFVSQEKTFDLGKYPLASRNGVRNANICVVGSLDRKQVSAKEDELISSLRLSNLLFAASDPRKAMVTTSTNFWEKDDVPEQPLYHCSFDVIVLTPTGLAELRSKQLEGLMTWTRAGGSLCVLLSKGIGGVQVDFLNRLVVENFESPFVLNTQGQLEVGDRSAENGMWMSPIDMGRVAIVDLSQVPDAEDSRWTASRSMSAYLWRARKDHIGTILSRTREQVEGDPNLQLGEEGALGTEFQGDAAHLQELVWQPMESFGLLLGSLMPDGVRVVPTPMVALVLFGYMLLVGPIDYYVLGFFRIRRFTWISFPLITMAIAYLMVQISSGYLTSKSTGKELVIRDLGGDGTLVSESRLQMIFSPRSQQMKHQLTGEILTPLDKDRLAVAGAYFNMGYHTADPSSRPEFTGRYLSQYEMKQGISQWQPQVNRHLRFADAGPVDPTAEARTEAATRIPSATASHPQLEGLGEERLDWVEWRHVSTESGRNELRERLAISLPEARAIVLHGEGQFPLFGSRLLPASQMLQHPELARARAVQFAQYSGDVAGSMSYDGEGFLLSVCAREPRGVFQFLSQVSPHGGDNFEDLAILDRSDLSQAVLLVGFPIGDRVVVYRRLFVEHGE